MTTVRWQVIAMPAVWEGYAPDETLPMAPFLDDPENAFVISANSSSRGYRRRSLKTSFCTRVSHE